MTDIEADAACVRDGCNPGAINFAIVFDDELVFKAITERYPEDGLDRIVQLFREQMPSFFVHPPERESI